MNKVLFIDSTHPVLPEILTRAGYQCDHVYHQDREVYKQILSDYTGIIIRSGVILDAEMISSASKVKFIGRLGSGMENIDTAYAAKMGIRCFNSPEGNRNAVAEHALGMLLSLNNHLCKANQQIRKGLWKREENRGIELKGKVVGIIGYGNTGSAFAEKLTGMGVSILAYDKYKRHFDNEWVREVSLEQVMAEADVLSLHIPLTEQTRYLVNTGFIEKFQKPFVLINTSRGSIVNTADLLAALKSGKLSGACLDVLEYEGHSFERISDMTPVLKELLQLEQVLLSPHIAGWTHESNRLLAEILAEKITAFISSS